MTNKRLVVLGAGESGTGAAILAKEKGFEVFVSDFGTISDPYRALLDQNGIAWEDGKHSEELILNATDHGWHSSHSQALLPWHNSKPRPGGCQG